jgi:hypothetical protein
MIASGTGISLSNGRGGSQHPVLVVYIAEILASSELGAGSIFAAYLILRSPQHIVYVSIRNYHHPVVICKDKITRVYQNVAARDGHIVGCHQPSSGRIDGFDARRENWKAEGFNLVNVAHNSIDYGASGSAGFSGGREQLTPRCIPNGLVCRNDNYFAGQYTIHGFNFHIILIRSNFEYVHALDCSGPSRKTAMPVQRSHVLPHGLAAQTNLVQRIRDYRGVQLLLNLVQPLLINLGRISVTCCDLYVCHKLAMKNSKYEINPNALSVAEELGDGQGN